MKKLVALTLVFVSVLTLFVGCGKSKEESLVLPVLTVEDTLEARQTAVVELAKAFWRKNPYMQYDNKAMNDLGANQGWRPMTDWESTPEHASWDMPVYTVCSAFAYDAVFQSFEYSLLKRRPSCLTKDLSVVKNVPEEIVVFQYTNNPNDAEANRKKMEEARSLLQPGDVVTYYRYNDSGHTVIFCGDLDGDGKGDILHSDGKRYDFKTGIDQVEESGTIMLNHKRAPSAEDFLFNPSFSEYLPKCDRYSIIRPANLSVTDYPLTEQVKTRLLYPDMAIYFTAECGNFGAVNVDGELTYTLRVENHGTTDYTDLLLQIPAPTNAKIVKVNGEATKKQLLRYKATIPAGGVAELAMTVVPTGAVGNRIVAEGGYVHTLPLPPITTAVEKTSFDAAAVSAAIKANEGKNGTDFVNGVWQTLSADAPTISAPLEVRDAIFKRQNIGEHRMYQLKTAEDLAPEEQTFANMLVPEYFGGYTVTNPVTGNHRVRTTRYRDLKPGDVLLWQAEITSEGSCAVFNGTNMITAMDGKNITMDEIQFEKLLSYNFFLVLRPTQAM